MKRTLLLLLSVLSCVLAFSQSLSLTLKEAMEIAKEQSVDALVARNSFLTSYWRFRNYKVELLPNVALEGNMPSINRSLSPYLKDDGTYGFVENSYLDVDATLSVSQNIPFSGGTLSFESQLQRIDQLGGDRKTGYLSVPLTVTLRQPLITPRRLKWAMKIEPERYKEAQQQFSVNMEAIYIKTIDLYFELLLAHINHDMAKTNSKNAKKLYEIAKGKRELGLISQNEILQLELGMINAESAVISSSQAYESKKLTLLNFLRIDDCEEALLDIPEIVHPADILYHQVLSLAQHNNPINHSIQRQLLESRMKINEANANRGFKADMFLSVGYTGSDQDIVESYRNLENRQILSLGVRIPILDWGKGRGSVKLAESELNVVKGQVEQAKISFEQNILLSVSRFHDQVKIAELATKADSIAQLRYETAFQTFLMGNVNVLDINYAQTERDNARRKYVNELYLSWRYYYNLRQISLYDFERKTEITYSGLIREITD